jgi:NAD(P)-dependent dehydrogenase (short-subunit alcohol dehydrogenase family)
VHESHEASVGNRQGAGIESPLRAGRAHGANLSRQDARTPVAATPTDAGAALSARLFAARGTPERIGTPEEVAHTALFLSSDEARFINATDILIDGGRSQLYHE